LTKVGGRDIQPAGSGWTRLRSKAATAWIERYRRFWEDQLDALHTHLTSGRRRRARRDN